MTQISKGESFSLKSVNDLANKLGMSHLADDCIYRVPSFDPPATDVILHTIKPKNLSLLEFLLIVNQVHTENRMYSVFEGQCYWFTQLDKNCRKFRIAVTMRHDALQYHRTAVTQIL